MRSIVCCQVGRPGTTEEEEEEEGDGCVKSGDDDDDDMMNDGRESRRLADVPVDRSEWQDSGNARMRNRNSMYVGIQAIE
jgi:hypothetical protein